MKLLIIDLDQNKEKVENFSKKVSDILEIETELLPIYNISKGKDYLYEKFVRAGFSLEEFLLNNFEKQYFQNKMYYNVLYVWGDYTTEKIWFLKKYQNIFLKNLVIFPTIDHTKNYNWIFGNVIAMTKWSTSVHKINIDMVLTTPREEGQYVEINREKLPLFWYPIRIGLDVKGINEE